MTLKEYVEYIRNPLTEAKSRVVIVPPGERLTTIHRLLKESGCSVLRLSDLVTEDAWLPMPHELFERISDVIKKRIGDGIPLILLGFTGYLALLSDEKKRAAIFALREWIDSTIGNEIVCLLHDGFNISSIIKDVFKNPRYRQGRQLIVIKPDSDAHQFTASCTEVIIVGASLVTLIPGGCDSLHNYLRYVEDYSNDSSIQRIVVASEKPLSGLSSEVQQLVCLQDVARVFYDVKDPDLSEEALHWICVLAKEKSAQKTLPEILKSIFFPDVEITNRVLCVLDRCRDIEREVILWLIKQVAPKGSYLELVVSQEGVFAGNFRSAYVISAVDCLDSSGLYADERKRAIQEANVRMSDADIRLFIEHCAMESTSRVAPWLNCGTSPEKAELLRRCFDDGIVSNAIKAVYPEVAAYLNDALLFDELALSEYFAEYRELKMTDRVTQEFCEKARFLTPRSPVQSRDALVQQFVADNQCALLVVDAMGVEWLPMLLVIAQEGNLGVESLSICEAVLPTTTKFNNIHWPSSERRLPDIKRFDNIVHNGIEAHETRLSEENLAAALDVIGNEVMPRLKIGLKKFERVLVTADHGSSRLAMLARRSEPMLARTLDCEVGAEITDWRYRKRAEQSECPPELEETLDGQHWVVRGYDRLPKKGGGQSFELHGGATLEERLVPVVIFSREGQFVPKAKKDGERVQIVEKDDFDL